MGIKMNSKEYVKLSRRTDSPDLHSVPVKLLHGAIGCNIEAGELLDTIKKSLFYGNKIDKINIIEELGDITWYMSLIIDELDVTWEEVWEKNIAKLKERYPQKFTKHLANNRDIKKEISSMEGIDK